MHNDALSRLGADLIPAQRAAIEREVEAEIQAAFQFAEDAPFPELAELTTIDDALRRAAQAQANLEGLPLTREHSDSWNRLKAS